MPTLILFNKPYGVLSQFRQDDNNDFATLSDYFTDKSLRVAGRLDATSEGLLLLTDDGQVNQALTAPPHVLNAKGIAKQHGKTYWVQVDGQPTDAQLDLLRSGVPLKDGVTLPAQVEPLPDDTHCQLWAPADNIAKRKHASWLAITIFEGKNRQVRRMTAHVGLPCLRLIRVASSGFSIEGIAVGEFKKLTLTPADLKRLGVSALTSSRSSTLPNALAKAPARPRKKHHPKPAYSRIKK